VTAPPVTTNDTQGDSAARGVGLHGPPAIQFIPCCRITAARSPLPAPHRSRVLSRTIEMRVGRGVGDDGLRLRRCAVMVAAQIRAGRPVGGRPPAGRRAADRLARRGEVIPARQRRCSTGGRSERTTSHRAETISPSGTPCCASGARALLEARVACTCRRTRRSHRGAGARQQRQLGLHRHRAMRRLRRCGRRRKRPNARVLRLRHGSAGLPSRLAGAALQTPTSSCSPSDGIPPALDADAIPRSDGLACARARRPWMPREIWTEAHGDYVTAPHGTDPDEAAWVGVLEDADGDIVGFGSTPRSSASTVLAAAVAPGIRPRLRARRRRRDLPARDKGSGEGEHPRAPDIGTRSHLFDRATATWSRAGVPPLPGRGGSRSAARNAPV
jgi:hypothetical protein